jgi:hypothetical protein
MKQGIKVLGLACLAMLSLMAIAGGSAQAENALVIEGKVVPEGKKVEIEAVGSGYKSLVPGLGLTLECGSAEIIGTAENVGSGEAAHAVGKGKLLAHECIMVGSKCIIYPTEEDFINETNPGLVVGSSGTIYVESIGSERYLKGSASGTVYHGGVFCTLPEESEIVGSAAGKIVEATTEAVEHTVTDITEKEEKELGVAAFFGEEPLFIDQGTASGKLIGKFEGQKFSVN